MSTLITEYRWDIKTENRPDILMVWKSLDDRPSWLAFKRGWLAHESRGYLKGSTNTRSCDCG